MKNFDTLIFQMLNENDQSPESSSAGGETYDSYTVSHGDIPPVNVPKMSPDEFRGALMSFMKIVDTNIDKLADERNGSWEGILWNAISKMVFENKEKLFNKLGDPKLNRPWNDPDLEKQIMDALSGKDEDNPDDQPDAQGFQGEDPDGWKNPKK